MVEIIARIAKTGLVEQGTTTVRLTREVVESFPDQVNGERSLPFLVEHDPFCMPIGKIKEAWVEPFEDEYAAMARIHVEDDVRRTIHMKSGTELVYLDFANAPKPFMQQFKKTDQCLVAVAVDLANFDNIQNHAAFIDAVKCIDDEITCEIVGRHSLESDPLIRFVLSYPEICVALSVGLWILKRVEKFIRYTVDETLKKTADEISDILSAKIKQIVSSYKNHQSGDKKPILIEVVVPNDIDLILLTQIDRDEEFPRINLRKLTTKMEKYGDLLQQAEEVTFARTGADDWEFQYLKTRTGEVFGTLECYKRTTEQFQRTQKESEGDN